MKIRKLPNKKTFIIITIACIVALFAPSHYLNAHSQTASTSQSLPCISERRTPIQVSRPDENGFFRKLDGALEGPDFFFLSDVILLDIKKSFDNLDIATELMAWPAAHKNRWGLTPAWIGIKTTQNNEVRLLQDYLIESGKAIFEPSFASANCARHLVEAENSFFSKTQKNEPANVTVLSATDLDAFPKVIGTHVLIDGKIVSLGKDRKTHYLNFGNKWKVDLTATIAQKHVDAFISELAKDGIDFSKLPGQLVRLRGTIQYRDGPYIELVHPGQLTVIRTKRINLEGPHH